jgi:tetratricopeptide (TPR) repeat protein
MLRPRVTLAALLIVDSLTRAQTSHAQAAPARAPSRTDKAAPAVTTPVKEPSAGLPPKVELEGPEAEAKERARVLFQQGVAAYREGRFYDAVGIFLQTQRVYPDTQLCFNIARAFENLGNASAALRYYRDYLREADRPSDGVEVRETVQRLEQQLAQRGVQQLTVLSKPEGSTVLLDGKPVGIAPWTGETYPGKHRLALVLDGHVSQERVVEIDAHQAQDFAFALTPQVAPAPRPAPVVLREQNAPGLSAASLVTLGVGVALLGTAVATQAASDRSGLSSPAAFFTGAGLGVVSVGGVMLYFDLSPRGRPSDRKDSASVRP